jgi:hypothetical protein
MKRIKITLALFFMTGLTPCLFAEEDNHEPEAVEVVEDAPEVEAVNNESNELKDLISAMKQERCVNKEQVNRLKKLIKEKGWGGKCQEDKMSKTDEAQESA